MPDEYLWLLLCRDVYHCPPSQLDREDWRVIADHIAMMDTEAKEAKLKREKEKLRRKVGRR